MILYALLTKMFILIDLGYQTIFEPFIQIQICFITFFSLTIIEWNKLAQEIKASSFVPPQQRKAQD